MASARRCWVTAVTNDKYLRGILALTRSLQAAKSRFPLIVMATSNLSSDSIASLAMEKNVVVKTIEPYVLPSSLITSYAFDRFTEAWVKLRGWEVEGYDILCWLDADMLVIHNMDEVFELMPTDSVFAACHACICNPSKVKSYPSWWTPENCHHSGLKVLNSTPVKPRYFNSGLFLFRPARSTLIEIEKFLIKKKDVTSYLFADQDFLNEFFPSWTSLAYIYNTLKTFAVTHDNLWDLKKVKNIHYILDKPWDVDLAQLESGKGTYGQITKLWWMVLLRLNDETLLNILNE